MDTAIFDGLVELFKDAKEKADHWAKQKELLKRKLIDALEEAGKTKYHVDGVGTVQLAIRKTVRTPKTLEEKILFWDYIEEKYGIEVMGEFQTVNSRSLNSFYKAEEEKYKGEAEFSIPGLDAPEEQVTLSLRSK